MSRQAGGNGRAPEGAKIHHWTRMASRPIIPGQGCNASVVSRHLNGVAWRRHLNDCVIETHTQLLLSASRVSFAVVCAGASSGLDIRSFSCPMHSV